ncbi:MAG: UrcA family protein [Lysobacteraceae bacterium]|nr:MAG: UrcA family protein [Xanthomonadaceae bacterium]
MMLKLALGALAALAIAPAAGAAYQENPLAKDSVVLNLKNIDLATVDGQRTLAIRMDNAARDVCGDRLDRIHLALEAKARSCRTAVIADIRTRIEARTADAGHAPRAVQVALR